MGRVWWSIGRGIATGLAVALVLSAAPGHWVSAGIFGCAISFAGMWLQHQVETA